jgi:hypothetical protein
MTNAEDQPLYRRLFWRANRSSSGSRLMNFSSGVAQAYAITPRIIGTKKNPKRPGTWDSCWLVWTRRQGRRGDRGCRPVHSDRRTHDERLVSITNCDNSLACINFAAAMRPHLVRGNRLRLRCQALEVTAAHGGGGPPSVQITPASKTQSWFLLARGDARG